MSKTNNYELNVDLTEVTSIGIENFYNFESKQFENVKNNKNISIGYIIDDDDLHYVFDCEEASMEDLNEEELRKDNNLLNIFDKYKKNLNKIGINNLVNFVFNFYDYKIILEDEEFDYIENIFHEVTDYARWERAGEYVNDFGYYGYWGGDSIDTCYKKNNKTFDDTYILKVFFTINFLESKTIDECFEEIEAFFYEDELFEFYNIIDFIFDNVDISIFSIEKLEIFKNAITKAEKEFFKEFDDEEHQKNNKRFLILFKNKLEQKLLANNTKTNKKQFSKI